MRIQPLYVRPQSWVELSAGTRDGAAYIAGGTDMIPLMRAGIVSPYAVIDVRGLIDSGIELLQHGIAIGGCTRLSDVTAHPHVRDYAPAVVQSLLAGASAQIRNMATMGGNLLQRTRCGYFRDPAFPCNKRALKSGCPALDSESRDAALFGASTHCAALHASDLAVALSAVDASIRLRSVDGQMRAVSINDLYTLPGERPDIETVLRREELIMQVVIPETGLARRSIYAKVRGRASFEFALVSVAVALEIEKGRIQQARIALGGVAPKPWRLEVAEARLRGCRPVEEAFREALTGFDDDARPVERNAFKLPLARNLILRSLTELATLA
jgi:xanthine dehydrogenase YagS FAD-binding subunit